ncbi:MAG TPA: OsmC family protein [Solirubrobacterales bacterium]
MTLDAQQLKAGDQSGGPRVAPRHARLRALYEKRPREALTRKHARTSAATVPASDPFHGEVEVGEGYGTRLRFGLDRGIGGLSDLPNPGDLLCAALAACADGGIRMIADLLGIALEELEVSVTGEVDLRGTLAIDPEVRVGFEWLRCEVRIRPTTGADPRLVRKLVTAAERHCVNLDTLSDGVKVEVRSQVQALGDS